MKSLVNLEKSDLAGQRLSLAKIDIAVLIPCYNEEMTIKKVIKDFAAALPDARVYVYDNNSTDNTVAVAAQAGALVRTESQQGKGHVIRRMFGDIEADIYVLVDGDDTYDASAAPKMIFTMIANTLDLVTGRRVAQKETAYPPGHRFGNWMLTRLVTFFFSERTRDILSGYRVFSRRFVKSFPALSFGFEIETEMTVHALELNLPIADVDTDYKDRPPGSISKLSTISDGIRILRTIAILVKEERPFAFFSAVGTVLAATSIILIYPVVIEFMDTGLVLRFPTAILSTGIMLTAILSFVCGLILDTVTHGRREVRRLSYLQQESMETIRDKLSES